MAGEANAGRIQQYLTFQLADESYGIEILRVQEIRGWSPVRKIPNTPSYIKGALNLRGAIVPIIDLRERFGMETVEYTSVTVVIVLNIECRGEKIVMGIVADSVSDVLDVNMDEVRAAPNLGTKIDTRYMRGMFVSKKGMIMLLNVDRLLDPDEFDIIERLGGE